MNKVYDTSPAPGRLPMMENGGVAGRRENPHKYDNDDNDDNDDYDDDRNDKDGSDDKDDDDDGERRCGDAFDGKSSPVSLYSLLLNHW